MTRSGLRVSAFSLAVALTLLAPNRARAQDEPPQDGGGGGDTEAVGAMGDTGTAPAGGDTGMDMAMGPYSSGVYTKATWPRELVHRPISLARGNREKLNVPIRISFDSFGVNDKLSTGISGLAAVVPGESYAIGTDNGLVLYKAGVYFAPPGLPQNPVTALATIPGPSAGSTVVVAAFEIPIGLNFGSEVFKVTVPASWNGFEVSGPFDLPLAGSGVSAFSIQTLWFPTGVLFRLPVIRAGGLAGSPNVLLAGLSQGGILRSTDDGSTWTFSNAGLPMPPPAVYQFAQADDGIYAATSTTVYRSTDQGLTWASANGNGGLPPLVTAIGAAGTTLYAGTASYAGIFKSTDGGANWHNTGSGMTATYPKSILATGDSIFVGTNAGVFSSPDGGNTWNGPGPGTSNLNVASLLVAGGQLYAGTASNLSGVYRSSNGGNSWSTADPSMNNQYVAGLAAAGGALVAASRFQINAPSGFFRSTDGGATWSKTQTGFDSPELGLFAQTVVSSGSSIVASVSLNGSKNGVYRSEDGGATWQASRTGLPDYVAPSVLAASGTTVLAGSLFNVYRSTDGGRTWAKSAFPGSSVFVTALAVAGNAAFACAKVVTPGSGKPGLYVSSDAGQTWAASGTSGLSSSETNYPVAVALTGSTVFVGLSGGGLYRSADGGTTWTFLKSPAGSSHVTSLAISGNTLYVGTNGRGILSTSVSPRVSLLVPIALDVYAGTAHFTTELSLTNRGTSSVPVTSLYTASLGSGSGTVTDQLPAGNQIVVADVLAYLRGKGLAIPSGSAGQQAGTILLTFDGVTDPALLAVTARTTTSTGAPQPAGSAGLAYPAIRAGSGVRTYLTVFGLRTNAADRSNVAVYNTGTEPVTVKLTARSGDADGAEAVLADNVALGAYEWRQFSFGASGLANGYVVIERLGGAGAFSGYGVINDNATNDGSFVFPLETAYLSRYLNVPVLVETGAFLSELVVSNSAPTAATLDLTYVESLSPAGGSGGTVRLTLPSGRQQIIPNAIDFLRRNGAAIGPQGAASYAGSLHVRVYGATLADVSVGARTAAQSPGGGQFGLFTPAFYPGSEALDVAFLYGLRSDANNRSNVAVVNTGGASDGSITVQLQAFDGNGGGAAAGSAESLTLGPGQWGQLGNFLASKGVQNGWVKVTRTSGNAPWVSYGVINDGATPGSRTGDGAYVPMVR